MILFELVATTTEFDWASRGTQTRLGLYPTREKAEARVAEIKSNKGWKMYWSSLDIYEVEVK